MVNFLIVGTGHNVGQYLEGCLDSILAQTYKNYSVALVNDNSTDNTEKIMSKYDIRKGWYCYHLEEGETTAGTVWARDMVLSSEKIKALDFDVIVWLDLDDELLPNALERLAKEYQHPSCWLTYGNYVNSDGRVFYDEKSIRLQDTPVRSQPFKFMHLRSFRRELYYKLSWLDLFPEKRTCYPDLNMLWCMMEMAGPDHIFPIAEVLYKYNTDNPNSILRKFSAIERLEEINFISKLIPHPPLVKLI